MRTHLSLLLIGLVACGGAPRSVPRAAPPESVARVRSAARSIATLPAGGAPRITSLEGLREGGSVSLARSPDGGVVAFAADEEGHALVTFDVDRRAVLAETPLAGAPAQALVLADGRVVVTLRDGGRVVALAPDRGLDAPLVERAHVDVADEPIGLAVSADGERLFVTSGWGARLTPVRASDLRAEAAITLPREPRAVLVEPDGKRAFVSHAIGGGLSVIDLATRSVSSVDLHTRGASRWGGGPDRSTDQGFALARGLFASRPDAPLRARIFAPAASIDPGEGIVSTEVYGPPNGSPVLPVVHVVDAARAQRIGTEAHTEESDVASRCNLPRAAALHGDSLFVACLGIDAVLELDARTASPMAVELRRFHVPAGPTGVALDAQHERAVVWSAFAHRLTVIDLRASAPTRRLAGVDAPPRQGWLGAELARGRALFHATPDPRITSDGRACASCHVDGREDGLVWSTPAGPRQTPMLAGRLEGSAPFGWTGARATLAGHVRDTWKRLGGAGAWSPADAQDLEAIARYVTAMKPPPRAGREVAEGENAALVARGRELFEAPAQGCASCHPGGHTDGQAHDVGSGEHHLAFDTPSLHFVGRTAPYFHDGRYGTLDDLLRGSDGAMGHTSHLADADARALVAYLETL